jgi:hypothetical protein
VAGRQPLVDPGRRGPRAYGSARRHVECIDPQPSGL